MNFHDMDSDNCTDDELREIEEQRNLQMDDERPSGSDEMRSSSPRPSTPIPHGTQSQNHATFNKGLPWVPKVRQRDIDYFLDCTRLKFVGYQLMNDRTSLAGLPEPIHEGLKVLQQVVSNLKEFYKKYVCT